MAVQKSLALYGVFMILSFCIHGVEGHAVREEVSVPVEDHVEVAPQGSEGDHMVVLCWGGVVDVVLMKGSVLVQGSIQGI